MDTKDKYVIKSHFNEFLKRYLIINFIFYEFDSYYYFQLIYL